ncbi:MAG TPA: prenyltransferase/squalene oxidase repeat-containing protein [Planctomycetota bacterium]|nr:prenyltransferase/squalene oxidase repeat-containing protein [Planctomycetota bacterium]
MDFLLLLRDTLRPGVLSCGDEFRSRHSAWLLAQQRPDGGFANRRGASDLYYTAFALRSLSALGALSQSVAEGAFSFLEGLRKQDAALRVRQPRGCFCDAVSATSWWDSLQLCEEILGAKLSESDRAEALTATRGRLAQLRRDDGGIAKTDLDGCGSLYHTLLASALVVRSQDRSSGGTAGQASSGTHSDVNELARFLRSLQLAEGGFLENRFSRRPATNGSAAGVVLAIMLGTAFPPPLEGGGRGRGDVPLALSEAELSSHVRFLASQQSEEGGWLAAPGAPMADLLSTFAALFVLKQCGWDDPKSLARAKAYAGSLEVETGGYIGFLLEQHADCEYTFYGLGVAAL